MIPEAQEIYGLAEVKGKKWDAAIVLQGIFYKETETVMEEFLGRNSNVLIILSTYLGDVKLMDDLYKLALECKGGLVIIMSSEPSREKFPDFWRTNHANQNLQRYTSHIGLKLAEELGIMFSLKCRSDTFLGRLELIQDFRQQLRTYPARGDVQGRIIVSGQGTITKPDFWAPFHVRDHWHFGYTKDLLGYFSISGTWRDGKGINISCPESAMTIVWMIDQGIEAKDTGELLGKYFIIENAVDVEQVRLTRTGYWDMDYGSYQTRGKAYLREIYKNADSPGNVTTREQWLELLSHYSPAE
jgi:hypothetical protein